MYYFRLRERSFFGGKKVAKRFAPVPLNLSTGSPPFATFYATDKLDN